MDDINEKIFEDSPSHRDSTITLKNVVFNKTLLELKEDSMTKEKAIKILKDRIEQYTGGVHPSEREILLKAFAVLRGPTPDPDTGLMPCGCGNQPDYRTDMSIFAIGKSYAYFWYECDCGQRTRGHGTVEQAKSAWNTAMGYKENI